MESDGLFERYSRQILFSGIAADGQRRLRAASAVVIGAGAPRLPNTSNVGVPGTSAETLVIALDLAGIAVSAGAACSSGKVGVSHVLQAMGIAPPLARAAVRVSLGWDTTRADIAAFLHAWTQIMNRTRERAVA